MLYWGSLTGRRRYFHVECDGTSSLGEEIALPRSSFSVLLLRHTGCIGVLSLAGGGCFHAGPDCSTSLSEEIALPQCNLPTSLVWNSCRIGVLSLAGAGNSMLSPMVALH